MIATNKISKWRCVAIATYLWVILCARSISIKWDRVCSPNISKDDRAKKHLANANKGKPPWLVITIVCAQQISYGVASVSFVQCQRALSED